MVARFNPDTLKRIAITILIVGAGAAQAATPIETGNAAIEKYEKIQRDLSQAPTGESPPKAEDLAPAYKAAEEALDTAETAFRQAVREDLSEAAALGLVNTLRLKGDEDLAAEVAGEALDKGIESAVLAREYGACLLRIGPDHTQDGVDALYQSLAWDGSSTEAVGTWNELGTFYLRESLPKSARDSFDAALKLDAQDVRARLGRLVVSVYDGEIANAGELLADVGKDALPFDTQLRRELRVALADFDEHRRTFSDTAENHFAYARLLYSAARIPQAMFAAERAAKLSATNIEMWNFLGAVQIQMGDLPAAITSYEASLKANAEQPMVAETLEKLREAVQAQAPAAPLAGQGMLR